MNTNEMVLEVKNLRVHYKTEGLVRAVDDVSFGVKKEEIFGLAGESGCGKTTLALAILKLAKPPCFIEGGEILLEGRDILRMTDEELRQMRWTKISYIPQASMNALNPVIKIAGQMSDAIVAHRRTNKTEAKQMITELLEQVVLSPKVADMFPHEMSGGMKQRAAIAMAMALNPSLIVADEPTTALDVNVQRMVLETLIRVKEEFGASLILITHDMAVHAEVVDRLAIMYAGKIVEIGDVESLFADPLHPYSKGLMLSIPTIEEKRNPTFLEGLPPDLRNPPQGCRFHPRCSQATDLCQVKEPHLIEAENGRSIACHLYRKE